MLIYASACSRLRSTHCTALARLAIQEHWRATLARALAVCHCSTVRRFESETRCRPTRKIRVRWLCFMIFTIGKKPGYVYSVLSAAIRLSLHGAIVLAVCQFIGLGLLSRVHSDNVPVRRFVQHHENPYILHIIHCTTIHSFIVTTGSINQSQRPLQLLGHLNLFIDNLAK